MSLDSFFNLFRQRQKQVYTAAENHKNTGKADMNSIQSSQNSEVSSFVHNPVNVYLFVKIRGFKKVLDPMRVLS